MEAAITNALDEVFSLKKLQYEKSAWTLIFHNSSAAWKLL